LLIIFSTLLVVIPENLPQKDINHIQPWNRKLYAKK
jgi:hypothetical protein